MKKKKVDKRADAGYMQDTCRIHSGHMQDTCGINVSAVRMLMSVCQHTYIGTSPGPLPPHKGHHIPQPRRMDHGPAIQDHHKPRPPNHPEHHTTLHRTAHPKPTTPTGCFGKSNSRSSSSSCWAPFPDPSALARRPSRARTGGTPTSTGAAPRQRALRGHRLQ